MSLYNALFGVNPFAPLLLSFLGTTPGQVPRFRDCYVDEKGRIVIHTRTGGGNRPYYERAESYKDETDEDGEGPWNSDLRALPGFLYDRDDDFDCTYADFIYQPTGEVEDLVKQLAALGGEANPGERWQKLFSDMRAGADNPQVARALAVGKPIIEQITEAFAQGGVAEGRDGEAGSVSEANSTRSGDSLMRPPSPTERAANTPTGAGNSPVGREG